MPCMSRSEMTVLAIKHFFHCVTVSSKFIFYNATIKVILCHNGEEFKL